MKDKIWNERCIIEPSLICLDMLHLEEQIRQLEANNIKVLHIDILDGYFSPSMPLGFETVRQLRKITDLAFDCHVMAQSPEYFVAELLELGVEQITFHIETALHADRLLKDIHSHNVRAGIALKPATPLGMLDYIAEECDEILIMQINPGYASRNNEQRVAYADRKIREVRQFIDERRLEAKLAIDGRVAVDQIRDYGNGIVDIFVVGTTCINRKNIPESMAKITTIRDKIMEQGNML